MLVDQIMYTCNNFYDKLKYHVESGIVTTYNYLVAFQQFNSSYDFCFQTMAVLLPTAAVSFKSKLCTNEMNG